MKSHLFIYCLYLADNSLIAGQRNSEWTAHGPVLEQDIAITNIALDLIGQARNFYQYCCSIYNGMDKKDKENCDYFIPVVWKSFNRELQEDDLAFLRDERQYLNVILVELPKGDWGFTVLRQFLFSSFQFFLYQQLQKSTDSQLAAIAEKSVKEVSYHLKWSSEWVIRLGDGTEESSERMKKSLLNLWPFTGELFATASFEKSAAANGYGADLNSIQNDWFENITTVLNEANLEIPTNKWNQEGGKSGIHTEHMGYLLAEMQYMQRAYPNLTW
ncbi:MAG TPA: 1,2-phenylacetyl-CoA epoxidase subunit PaaC [Flavisolibacter sp.]|jgi:ring-1,2-phenylacetyl-CoA epoxidase subunit PaaC|nr:1,2-phenylacetyl-CoA epoxidase subunit PaaC [Flavisolibacter sp.]